MIIKAAYGEELEGRKVKCLLCPAECVLTEGKVGICGSRFNRGGQLMTDNFGELVTACYDPIEKKPLYHFYPGSTIFSTGANGCNFSCDNCQNWEISQTRVATQFVPPEGLLDLARRNDSIGVAFTYTEPMIWFEYILQAGRLIKESGLKNVLVTNGYVNREPLEELLPLIDAANIDLKGMNPRFYKRVCKGKLEPVLNNVRLSYEAGVHIEITNLVIPEMNDSDSDFMALIDFVADVSKSIPLHFSAYYPTFKMTKPPTPISSLLRAYELAAAKLDYVYLGNVRLPEKSDTYCPSCRKCIIRRRGYAIDILSLKKGRCGYCGQDTGILMAG
jgi:pyruvate formate lyase activating enzyme